MDLVKNGIGSWYQNRLKRSASVGARLRARRTRVTRAIQPGSYQLVFRAQDAFGSKFTEVKNFTVTTGATVKLKFSGV